MRSSPRPLPSGVQYLTGEIPQRAGGLSAQRLAFSSDGAKAGPEEARRFAHWLDEYRATLNSREIAFDPDRPFSVCVEYVTAGGVGLGRSYGSVTRIERRRDHLARDGVDNFKFVINCGAGATEAVHRTRATMVSTGAAMLFNGAEPSTHAYGGDHLLFGLHLPRRLVLGAMPDAEDWCGVPIPAGNQALPLLTHFAGGLIGQPQLTDPAVSAHAGRTLLDLVVLAFGANRDNSEVARLGGLRTARLDAVLRIIRASYTDPDLTPGAVAARIGISTRYLHDLLHETGTSFAERVKDLRLARALDLLTHPVGAPHRITDAAYEAGFSDLSYFNRCFRRKFGLTPTSARGAASGGQRPIARAAT
jgi:AraC-like DNA-binding protein